MSVWEARGGRQVEKGRRFSSMRRCVDAHTVLLEHDGLVKRCLSKEWGAKSGYGGEVGLVKASKDGESKVESPDDYKEVLLGGGRRGRMMKKNEVGGGVRNRKEVVSKYVE